MITVTETAPNVYHLIETVHGWTGVDWVQHWYYDLNKMLLSEKPDFPEGMVTRALSKEDDSYQWFIKYCLPKAVKGY